MSEPAYYLVSFDRTSATMQAEKLFKENNITHAMMPTPRSVQASCGLSIRFGIGDFEQVQTLLSDEIDSDIYRYYAAFKQPETGHTDYHPLYSNISD